MLMVPMFHSNAWGLPYSGWMSGADFVMPQSTLDAASLARMFNPEAGSLQPGVGSRNTSWSNVGAGCAHGDGSQPVVRTVALPHLHR